MKKKNKAERRQELLTCICSLPRKMTQVHGIENLTEFLLYHLADERCFNFSKAAYFVDNPDFDVFRGVSGFHKLEAFKSDDHWQHVDEFTSHMKDASFNRRVRSVGKKSSKKQQEKIDPALIELIAQELELEKPQHYSWKMKYDNHGLLVFELADQEDQELVQESLEESLYLLGFCPVF